MKDAKQFTSYKKVYDFANKNKNFFGLIHNLLEEHSIFFLDRGYCQGMISTIWMQDIEST